MSYYMSDDGVKIYYKHLNKKSNKTPLVFVHGWLANWTCFKREIEFFASEGYPILYLDLRGHGLSDKPEEKEKYHLDLMADDLRGILKKESIEKINLIGHSMGGMVSSVFTYKYQDFLNSLIVIDSSYENPLFSSKIIYFHKHKRFARHLCDYIVNHSHIKTNNRNIKELDFDKIKNKSDALIVLDELLHTPLHVVFAALEAMFDYNLRGKLKKIKTPTLIIGSDQDQLFGKRLELYFKKQIPHSELVMDKGTHLIIIKNPELISKQIETFLSKVERHNKRKNNINKKIKLISS